MHCFNPILHVSLLGLLQVVGDKKIQYKYNKLLSIRPTVLEDNEKRTTMGKYTVDGWYNKKYNIYIISYLQLGLLSTILF